MADTATLESNLATDVSTAEGLQSGITGGETDAERISYLQTVIDGLWAYTQLAERKRQRKLVATGNREVRTMATAADFSGREAAYGSLRSLVQTDQSTRS